MLLVALFLLSLLTNILALDTSIECINGIQTVVSRLQFTKEKSICSGDHHVHTLWAAAKLYCSPEEIDAGSAMLAEECLRDGSQLVPYTQILPRLSDGYIRSLPVVDFTGLGSKKVWSTPVLISRELCEIARRTTTVLDREIEIRIIYGWGFYGFWGGILVIGIINRLLTFLFCSWLAKRKRIDVEGGSPVRTRLPVIETGYHWIKTKLVLPATIWSYHQRAWCCCSIPTRLEAIVILLYWCLTIILCATSYETFYPNIRFYPETHFTQPYQAWAYLSHRAATFSLANLPILWLVAGRNNIFLWATGWRYSTFNVFHRHIAQVVVILAIIHAISSTVTGSYRGTYIDAWNKLYYRMGAVAVVSFSFIIFCSSIIFRERCYEFFLLVHRSLAILSIIAVFFHLPMKDRQLNSYLWSVAAIWVSDRLLRVIRIAYYNLGFGFSGGLLGTIGTATYNEQTDVIRLEAIPKRKIRSRRPGHHYFLYQPLRWRSWENHPFTLATWTPVDISDTVEKQTGFVKQEPQSMEVPVEVEKAITISSYTSPGESLPYNSTGPADTGTLNKKDGPKKYKLVFWIRPHSGWTKYLRDVCLKDPGKPLQTKILIEGPYGNSAPLHRYDNVLYIICGTGISVAACYLTDHISRSANNPPTTRTRHIKLLWTSKQAELIQDVSTQELAPILKRSDVSTSFFATKQREAIVQTQSQDKDTQTSSYPPSTLEISYCRPNIRDEILKYVDNISSEEAEQRTAILVSGPAAMADEARATMQTVLNRGGGRRIQYFEETYGW